MKVFYVIDSYEGPNGGTEKQLLLLVREMQKHGHEIRLFVLRHTNYTRAVPDFPCPIELLDIHSVRSIKSLRRLMEFRSLVARENPDVVHVFFNDAAILLPPFCRRAGTLVITSRRDMGFWYSRTNLLLLRLANLWVDYIICNCEAVARHVAIKEWVPERKLVVIHNGAQLFSHERPRTVESARQYNRVCLLANIRSIKRIQDLINAAAIVSHLHPTVEFVIVGEILDQPYHDYLKSLVHQLGLTDRVTFAGHSGDPASWLSKSDIGVLTSASEGLSNSILEYMSAGLPVVCSKVGGNRELVFHDENGYLYDVGDVAALARHLDCLCSDSELRERLGSESLRRVQRFAPEQMMEKHLMLYQQPDIAVPHEGTT